MSQSDREAAVSAILALEKYAELRRMAVRGKLPPGESAGEPAESGHEEEPAEVLELRALADGFGGAGDNDDLEAVVVRRLDRYFARLDGRAPHPLYDLVVHAVERPLIDYAMAMCRQNQCAAAQLLGINRNTLRKKLREHGMLSAQGTSKKFKEK